MDNNTIYALDFDGVVCDSAIETAITGFKAAATLWQDMPGEPTPAIIEQFRTVRPIIETGYEAILAMRLLYLGTATDAIYKNYTALCRTLLDERQVTVDGLKQLFGSTRDAWIAEDLSSWIGMNPLFVGVAEKLRRLGQYHTWYIITTKQERFVRHILHAHGINLAAENIFGLDRNLSKVQVLKKLLKVHPYQPIHFVEDRLPTLVNVLKEHDLVGVTLIFALWGYNTDTDKTLAASKDFTLQQLDQFLSF